ncbi:hypothetical protein SAMN04487972_101108 [Paracoccus halophilus]|uniref:Uncharacterized protein n=1 Tax=Paracoccus halophilus TaxID=376733 RepID=A0A099F890_9RHOB|nr:hypothetical protein [Paracoccus halophilus]KGJ06446.1 hypothetical protein IT41_02055 [Paracoccus halophilus]SFA38260.1 hypothetical protein SAMN04487972_101108 [Paracoccus halophilus]
MTDETTPFPADEHDLLLSVKELRQIFAEAESEKAQQAGVASSNAEKQRRELIERLKSNEPIDEKMIENFLYRLKQVALKGKEEIMVGRFPNELCTDRGRAINQAEEDWPETLTGRPRQVYELWREHLKPLGYKLKAQIVDWPHGMPGDVGMFVAWEL